MVQDLLLISYAWILTFIWQWLALPWLITWFKHRSLTAGWAFGRLLVWMVLSLFIWFTAHLGLPTNTPAMIWLLLLVMGFLSYRQWQVVKPVVSDWIKVSRWSIFCQEILFLVGFFGLSLVRTYQPNMMDLEKFMDAGLMIAYWRSPTLPLQDMWLAGQNFNYYTFGHFLGAIVSQFWGIEIRYSYNLLLGLICGLVLMESFAVVADLVVDHEKTSSVGADTATTQANGIKAGLIGAFLVGLGGNGQAMWYWLKNRSFSAYWYPDATRFIDRTIHEFPSYSFIVSDLHAHVWGIPFVLWLVWLIWLWSRQWASHKITSFGADLWWNQLFSGLVLTIGVVLGVLIMTSTWDFAIYGLVLAWVSFGVLCQDYRRWLLLIAMGIVMVAVALITSSPWWLHFDSISQGVKLAYDHSPLWQLAVLWLPHLSFVALSLGFAVRKWQQLAKTPRGSHSIKLEQQSTLLLITALALSAVTLLILPELIFVKDIYPNHPRANTMFKLTFQAFILMGLVIAWGSGQIMALLNRSASTQKSVSKTWLVGLGLALGLGVFVVGVGIYPYFGYRDYYGAFKTHYGLDGLQWLKVQAPDDFEALNWLKQTTHGRPVVLEAVGESYTTYARVSTFTGLPTVLGWRVHEWLWRGGFEIPGQRTEEVRKIYETPNLPESKTLLAQYQVKYIFVGSLEREAYVNLDLKGLENLGPVVFRSHETEIIQVD